MLRSSAGVKPKQSFSDIEPRIILAPCLRYGRKFGDHTANKESKYPWLAIGPFPDVS